MKKANKHTAEELKQWQALPLNVKILMTQARIRAWVHEFGEEGVYVSFSGGKDSTVLLDIVRNKCGYVKIPAVFVDTGLEFPEIREFVKSYGDIVTWVKPKMNFKQVIQTYGYPVISKDVSQCVYDVATQARIKNCDKRSTYLWDRAFNPESDYAKKYPSYSRARYDFLNDAPFPVSNRCCNVIKKNPAKDYEKKTDRKPIMATMACESRIRATQWIEDGCNAFDVKRPTSKPMSFWTEQDVLQYIRENGIQICSVYGDIVEDISGTDAVEGQMTFSDLAGIETTEFDAERPCLKTTGMPRTGCMFCGYGCQSEKQGEGRFERMKKTHPKTYEWIMKPWDEGGLGYKEVIDWMNEHGNLDIRY